MNRVLLAFISVVIISCVIISCDCIQHIQGIVVDSEYRLPIEGVMVSRTDIIIDSISQTPEGVMPYNEYGINWDCGIHGVFTDSLGIFEFTYMTGYLLFSPNISLRFEKDGYSELKKKYKGFNKDTIIVVLDRKN